MEFSRKLSWLLRRRLGELKRLLQAVHLRSEPDDIHDLRVLTRRLRSMAWVADRILGPGRSRPFRRDLQRIGRALGECRALDVAVEDADPLLRPVLEELRTREGPNIRRITAGRRVLERGDRLVRRLERSTGERVEIGRFEALSEELERRPPASASKTRLHEYRIEVKKCRYVLETLHHLGVIQDRPHEHLRKVQSALGRAHDLEVLRRLTRKLSPGRPSLWLRPLLREERRKIGKAIRLSRQAVPHARRALLRAARRFEVRS